MMGTENAVEMTTIITANQAVLDKKFAATVQAIRKRNFERNLPFLILSEELPEGQAYREFADGRIELQEVFTSGGSFESRVVKVLSLDEAGKIRTVNGLS